MSHLRCCHIPKLLLSLGCILFCVCVITDASAKSKPKPKQTLPAASPMSALSVPALTSEQRAALTSVRADPAPEEIIRNSHYWVSNEHNHQLWRDTIVDLGGALVGVGTDQNYLLAGWARSSLIILMDFDEKIPVIHEIYAFFFSISSTPEDFHRRWLRKYSDDSVDKLTAHFTALITPIAAREADNKGLDDAKREKFIKRRVKRFVRTRVRIYKTTRGLLWRRLNRTKKKYQELKIPTFLSDQAEYDHIRSLWVGGRVLAIRGDLTADYTMLDISKALKALDTPLNVLYTSNAEQYFDLTPTYRRNIIASYWGERGVTLRTMAWGSLGFYDEKEQYHYNIQPSANFVAWMRESRVKNIGRMMFRGRTIKERGFSVMTKLPPKSKRPPKVAAVPE